MGDVLTTSRSSPRRYWCIHTAQLLRQGRSMLVVPCAPSPLQVLNTLCLPQKGRWRHVTWGRWSVPRQGARDDKPEFVSAGPSLLPWHVQTFIVIITILLLLIKRHPLAQPSHIPNLKQVSVFCRTDAVLDPVLYCVALMSLEKASCTNTDLWNEILFLF